MAKMYNKVAAADLAKEFPGFDWAAWTAELKVASVPALVIAQPSYVRAVAAAVNEWPVDRWKPYLTHLLQFGRDLERRVTKMRLFSRIVSAGAQNVVAQNRREKSYVGS